MIVLTPMIVRNALCFFRVVDIRVPSCPVGAAMFMDDDDMDDFIFMKGMGGMPGGMGMPGMGMPGMFDMENLGSDEARAAVSYLLNSH